MQSSGWEMGKNKLACADTFFTSEFFDFNNETSQIEDFDISKQYLNSELSQKSTILRHMSEEYFLKAIEVHYKFSLIDSLIFWRKINEKEKRKEALNPKNMTKVFLKMFYLLNKKIRSKLEKAFVKTTNFTKQHDMKTYETPMVIGLKRLAETLETLNSKYCYGNPMYSQHLKESAFYEIKLFDKIIKNKEQLTLFGTFLQKMSKHIEIQHFRDKLNSYQKLCDKLEIFFGTLSLLINPIKRCFFQNLKTSKVSFPCILNELDDSIKDVKSESMTKDLSAFVNKETAQNFEIICQNKNTQVSEEIKACCLVEQLGSKKSSQEGSSEYFDQLNQNQRLESNEVSDRKNSLKFSKQLRRKSPSFEKKHSVKFKSIPAGTPKKTPQSAYVQNNLDVKQNIQVSNSEIQLNLKGESVNIDVHESKMNLGFIFKDQKSYKMKNTFQNSLNYGTKSSRIISKNEKIIFTTSHKPHQLTSSYPDYFDFYAFAEIPFDKKLREAQRTLKSKEENKKGFTIFKTIKSGKSQTNFDEISNATPTKQSFANNQPKISFKVPQNQTEMKMNLNSCKQAPRQKLINFKSLQKTTSNSSLHDLKHDYMFPVAHKSNKNLEALTQYDSIKPKNDFYLEYQTNPYQTHLDPNLRQNRIEKNYESSKNTELTFKTNRPMKKVKSSDKEIVIKSIQGKKDRKNQKSSTKIKRPKQIKSDFIDSKQQIFNLYYKMESPTMLSVRSAKSVSQKCIHKNLGPKLNLKK